MFTLYVCAESEARNTCVSVAGGLPLGPLLATLPSSAYYATASCIRLLGKMSAMSSNVTVDDWPWEADESSAFGIAFCTIVFGIAERFRQNDILRRIQRC